MSSVMAGRAEKAEGAVAEFIKVSYSMIYDKVISGNEDEGESIMWL